MASLEFLAIILTGLGLTASIIYYASILRNANKTQQMQLETRKAQLFMNIFQNINSEESHKTWADLMSEQFDGYNDWVTKYDHSLNAESFSKRTHIWYTYNCIGFLLQDGIIDIELANNVVGVFVILQWMKYGDLIKELREKQGLPRYYVGFEYLVDELMKYYEEYPDMNHVNSSQYIEYINKTTQT